MWACPTEALVMFPEGSQPPPLQVPEIDENFQTAVPGQYLIGEVAGKPLVKSAANLGRGVIEHMLRTGLRPGALGSGGGAVDVAIVGSGPGGATAAEIGRWTGQWQDSVVQGRYLARWQHSDIGWRIAAELYVPLLTDGE